MEWTQPTTTATASTRLAATSTAVCIVDADPGGGAVGACCDGYYWRARYASR